MSNKYHCAEKITESGTRTANIAVVSSDMYLERGIELKWSVLQKSKQKFENHPC
jgi:hypothetical protein